jgi:hypothetical protein
VDDELHKLLGRFEAGVRVLVISDSCMSGTITKKAGAAMAMFLPSFGDVRSRDMPRALADRVYASNKRFYDDLQTTARSRSVKTRIELLAACGMQELAYEEGGHGRFTEALLHACKHGGQLTYARLFDLVRERMRGSNQSPRRYAIEPAPPASGDCERQMCWFDTETAFVI